MTTETTSMGDATALSYLLEETKKLPDFNRANEWIFKQFGIVDFFENDQEFCRLKYDSVSTIENSEKVEYGDFQTNKGLSDRIVELLVNKNISPQIIIEPTVGKGNFVISALKHFENVEKIIAVEIYKPYLWECKLAIVEFYLHNKRINKPQIYLVHDNIFSVNFDRIAKEHLTKKFLILGNPPWVTNSKLGALNSDNLPLKSNFKEHKGLEALTGKSNFDIAEYICTSLIRTFQHYNGSMALLVKNTVIKNIVFDQQKNKFNISNIEKHTIDSKKEFNVSADASLFMLNFNQPITLTARERSIYEQKDVSTIQFGWVGDKFVSNVDKYAQTQEIDGKCFFEWRQGIKHDCAQVMELEKMDGYFLNKRNEKVELEEDIVYPILKSSDLKDEVIWQARKYTIVPQQKIGQATDYIEKMFPFVHQYLYSNIGDFNARKSSIYRNKPSFSIFGVGSYSFQPFKIAISGLYKNAHFSLILPQDQKPILVDDTCYMLGFDRLDFAVYTLILLNSEQTKAFLQSITFKDAKRMFTKEILKRIDLSKLAKQYSEKKLQKKVKQLNEKHQLSITLECWDDFMEKNLNANPQKSLALF